MPDNDFAAAILENEVVLTHIDDGHVYHFPILANGTVSLQGARFEPNPKAQCNAAAHLIDAHGAARTALSRSRA